MAYYLQLEGIPGEISMPPRINVIQLMSWSRGQQSAPTLGTSASKGQKSTNELRFTMEANVSAPALFQACFDGRHIRSGELFGIADDGRVFLRIAMTDIVVASLQMGGRGGDRAPVYQGELAADKLEVQYQAAPLTKSTTAGWSTNTP